MPDTDQRLLMLIDADSARARVAGVIVARDGWRQVTIRDPETAIATLGTPQGMKLDAIIVDQSVPGEAACALVSELRSRRASVPILLVSENASPLSAVDAMRAGASDYLIRPFPPERLLEALRAATRFGAPAPALQPLTQKFSSHVGFETLIGKAPAFRAALAVAAKAARAHHPVLIEGESGTGKEALIQAMHAASPRSKMPLHAVDLATVPAHSHRSLLFGHEQGAFPGAFSRHHGALHHADGGTLVIDGVDQLESEAQAMLAQAIVCGEVRPIGARHSFRVDVRIIAATDIGLHQSDFLSDLAILLSATKVAVPPLRERVGDIPALARHFLAQIGEQPGLRPLGITDGALALLSAYAWPGNARQLQATLFRASVFCDGDALTEDDFPDLGTLPAVGPRGSAQAQEGAGVTLYTSEGHLRPLEDIEADVIRLAIGHYRGRMTEVARRLGIGRSTLYRKLGELGIENAA